MLSRWPMAMSPKVSAEEVRRGDCECGIVVALSILMGAAQQ